MASRSPQGNSAGRGRIKPALITSLAQWFKQNARDLPWRRNPTPYRVWVSEVMLQQTRVEVVRDYFRRFMKRFPSLKALAAAPEDDVLAAWSGLGYYRRARMLHAAAKRILAHHGGRFPRDAEAIEALPGVGRYTAGAIRSIAFNEPAPIVDGNIERVFARLFAIRQPVKLAAVQRQLWKLAGQWVSPNKGNTRAPRVLNQALMELGATACTPRSPSCDKCPLAGHCAALQLGLVETIPMRGAATRARRKRLLCLALRDGARRVWLVRREDGRPASVLPDGLWELPHADWPDDAPFPADLLQLGCKVLPTGRSLQRTHAVMDWRLTLCVLPARAAGRPKWSYGPSGWFSPEQALQLPLASATRKLLEPILVARTAALSRNSAALL